LEHYEHRKTIKEFYNLLKPSLPPDQLSVPSSTPPPASALTNSYRNNMTEKHSIHPSQSLYLNYLIT